MLASASLADSIRGEIDELSGLLKDNLQKIVQHGKRADSIVRTCSYIRERAAATTGRPT